MIRTTLIATLLLASAAQSQTAEQPEDLTSTRDLTEATAFWKDFLGGLDAEIDRDPAGNISFAQCIARARAARIACQQRATDGVGSESCYLREDRARQWCFTEWDELEP
ncbi:hypothetical protein [Roseobacter sp. HKCCA0434]|uniref:hypothetical protein n=1 Tax=Roseobacter sp. HKCCA0434 TaxID=3079297 RepID=UPI002905ED30|nr:hypothetical protein [Roseobacter sp. HKCCA0434]